MPNKSDPMEDNIVKYPQTDMRTESDSRGHRNRPTERVPGVLDERLLPDPDFNTLWSAIVLPDNLKDQLLCQSILNFTLRYRLSRAAVPLHGLIVLVGPPGTGKTSLARGLATRIAESFPGETQFRYVEVEPHGLTSSSLGRSQKAVRDFLGETIAERACMGPLIVLLDEVETLATDRSKLSLEANPVDVHRATDAVLAQLDQLATNHPALLFIATSNFPEAIDSALISRADLVVTINPPDMDACGKILDDTLRAFADEFPGIKRIIGSDEFKEAAGLCVGLDGRQIRKGVVTACTFHKGTALDPNRLTGRDLIRAVRQVNQQSNGGVFK